MPRPGKEAQGAQRGLGALGGKGQCVEMEGRRVVRSTGNMCSILRILTLAVGIRRKEQEHLAGSLRGHVTLDLRVGSKDYFKKIFIYASGIKIT